MLDVEDFDSVFPQSGYSDGLETDIQENRTVLRGRLLFERLLELLSIKGHRIYPPKGESGLRDLHKRIVDSNITLHYKHCLVFYLLKDLSPSHHGATELAAQFAQDVHLEKRFQIFVEGIWDLDHLQFQSAVGNLTHPSIIPTFPDEILHALLNRKRIMNVPVNDALPLAYYNCAKPPLSSEKLRTEFVKYMAARNVTETYYWIRARPEAERVPLLEALVEQTMDRSYWSTHNSAGIYPVEQKADELVGLPFDEEEEEWFDNYLTEGNGRGLKNAEDTVLMRRVATGKLQQFSLGKGSKGRKHDGVNWEILRDGVKRGLGPRKDEEAFVV